MPPLWLGPPHKRTHTHTHTITLWGHTINYPFTGILLSLITPLQNEAKLGKHLRKWPGCEVHVALRSEVQSVQVIWSQNPQGPDCVDILTLFLQASWQLAFWQGVQ